jgi:hypothetical protein
VKKITKIPISEDVKEVCRIVQGSIVGGSIRDYLLNRPIHDYDIASPFNFEKNKKLLYENGIKTIDTGSKFGTITAMINGKGVEITTFRSETYTEDKGRFPDVTFHTNQKNDLMRRDFTINSIAYNPFTEELIDPNNGVEDITNKLIKFVGKPSQRIKEDPLRMIRACRFASNYDFKIDEDSLKSIQNETNQLSRISKERIVMEIQRVSDFASFTYWLGEANLFGEIFDVSASVLKNVYHDNRGSHYGESLWEHTINVITGSTAKSNNYGVYLASLFHDMGKISTFSFEDDKIMFKGHEVESVNMFLKFAETIPLPTIIKKLVVFVVSNHMRYPLLISKKKIIKQAIDWKIANIPLNFLETLSLVCEVDRGISFEGTLNKIKEVWNVEKPKGDLVSHIVPQERSRVIRDLWINKAHDSVKWNIESHENNAMKKR